MSHPQVGGVPRAGGVGQVPHLSGARTRCLHHTGPFTRTAHRTAAMSCSIQGTGVGSSGPGSTRSAGRVGHDRLHHAFDRGPQRSHVVACGIGCDRDLEVLGCRAPGAPGAPGAPERLVRLADQAREVRNGQAAQGHQLGVAVRRRGERGVRRGAVVVAGSAAAGVPVTVCGRRAAARVVCVPSPK